jgi:hypothetical protein
MGQDKPAKIDLLPATLRGRDFTCNCTVELASKVTRGAPGTAVKTILRITASDQLPPDGAYDLDVRGRIFKVRRHGGEWPTVPL